MAVEQYIRTVAETVAPTFPDEAPFDTPAPYVVYRRLSGSLGSYMDGTLMAHERALVKLTLWADTRKEATEKMNALVDEFAKRKDIAFSIRSFISDRVDEIGGSPLRGASVDFEFFAPREKEQTNG